MLHGYLCKLPGRQFAFHEGETGRNAYSRGLEHRDDLKNEKEDTPLWKHCLLAHKGVKQSFAMKPLRSIKKSPSDTGRRGSQDNCKQGNIPDEQYKLLAPGLIIQVVASSGLAGDQGEDQAPDLLGGAGRSIGRGGRGGGGERQEGAEVEGIVLEGEGDLQGQAD